MPNSKDDLVDLTPPEVRIVRGLPLGTVVYLKHRDEEKPGVVIGINTRIHGSLYVVAWPHCNGAEQVHHAIELSTEYVPSLQSN